MDSYKLDFLVFILESLRVRVSHFVVFVVRELRNQDFVFSLRVRSCQVEVGGVVGIVLGSDLPFVVFQNGFLLPEVDFV